MDKVSKTEPIRILQIGMHDKIGGVETFLMNYYRVIDKNKIQFDFICPYETLCFEDEIEQLGGKIYKIPFFKKHPLKYEKAIKKIVRDNNYKIIHVNMLSSANILPIVAAKKGGAERIILHSHSSNTPKNPIKIFLNKLNKKRATKISTDLWACSEKSGIWLYGKKQKFNIINNAINIQKFSFNEKNREEIRLKYNIQEGEILLGNIGRLEKIKNQTFLLNLIRLLPAKYKLMIIGDGNEEKRLKKQATKLNISERITFLPSRKDIEKYYSAFDFFLLPSLFEGLPVSAVEAQINGLHTVLSDTISKDTCFSKNCAFLSISNPNIWADYLISSKTSRIPTPVSPYDINNAVKNLEQYYLDMEQIV